MTPNDTRTTKDARQRAENIQHGVPQNTATSWTPEEDQLLRNHYAQGLTCAQIALLHERGEIGILQRLVELQLLDNQDHFWDSPCLARTIHPVHT